MSRHCWEHGEITLPTAAVAPLKKALRDTANAHHVAVLALCKDFWTAECKKTRSATKYRAALNAWRSNVAQRSLRHGNAPRAVEDDAWSVLYGYTNLGANHIEVNPVVYTREKVLNTGGLMKSARGNLPRYVIAHEYGHALGAGKDHDHEVEQVWVDHPGVSLYGRTKPTEGAAEAYADWVMTGGKTDNEFTKAMAKLEGWS